MLPYKDANWLVIVAPEEIIAAAIPLVEELDRERPPELEVRVLPVFYADAEEVARRLDPLFQKRPEKRVEELVQITSHARSNSLMILSSEKNFEVVRSVVKALDTEESIQMATETYELEYADAEDIVEQLNDLYSGSQQTRNPFFYYYSSSRRNTEQTRFVAETRSNSVIAIARPNEFDNISELIKKLDTPLDADQAAPRIYRLTYVDATELTEVLNELFGGDDTRSGGYYDYLYGGSSSGSTDVGRLYGKVKFVPETSTNAIIVTTNNKENFRIIEGFIRELDRNNPEAANTMVVSLQNAKAVDLAEQLNTLFAMEGARAPQRNQDQEQTNSFASWLYGGNQQKKDERAISNLIGQVRVVPDERTNSLVISAAAQHFDLLRALVTELDIESPKVLVRVNLLEVTTTRSLRIGTRYSSDPAQFTGDDFDNGLRSNFGFGFQDIRGSGTLSADVNIGLLVQFLQRHIDTKIISQSAITANNNQQATIFVGSEIPFITESQPTPDGSLRQSFDYRNAGTTLEFTPNINQLDTIVMNINLESSQIRPGETLFGGAILDTRRFNTNLAVKIGGIIRHSESDAIRRVPILGHIPILNLAFRKKDKKRETTELMAFITPTVLRSPAEDRAATQELLKSLQIIPEWESADKFRKSITTIVPEED